MALYTVMIPVEADTAAEAFMMGDNIHAAACVIGYEGDLQGFYTVAGNIVTDDQITESDNMEDAASAMGSSWIEAMRVDLPDVD